MLSGVGLQALHPALVFFADSSSGLKEVSGFVPALRNQQVAGTRILPRSKMDFDESRTSSTVHARSNIPDDVCSALGEKNYDETLRARDERSLTRHGMVFLRTKRSGDGREAILIRLPVSIQFSAWIWSGRLEP